MLIGSVRLNYILRQLGSVADNPVSRDIDVVDKGIPLFIAFLNVPKKGGLSSCQI